MINNKNNLNVPGIIIISLILIGVSGITYAFNDKDNNINANTLELSVNYSDVVFSGNSLVPINDDEINVNTKENVIRAEFNVKGHETNYSDDIIYDVILKDINIDCELISEYVKWNLYKNGLLISSGNTSPMFDKSILDNKLVLTNERQKLMEYKSSGDNYVFILWISDPCSNLATCNNIINHNNMLGKTIEGKMSVGLYTTKKDINELEERTREITNEIICS